MKSYHGMRRLVVPALLASAAFATPVFAQNAAAAEANAADGNEIIVTAQRRAERLENVPAAVVAITPDILARNNITDLHELGRVAPGVQINFGGAYTQPAVRGVTSLTNGTGNENNIAVYVDGFYVNDNITINTDLANLASIEVLKGPQGTLYGRNATGGAILINTLSPTDEFRGKFEGSYGRFDEKKVLGYISGPIAPGIGFSIAGAYRSGDGNIKFGPAGNPFRSGSAAKFKQRSVRTKLAFELSENLTATVAYNYAVTDEPRGLLFTPFEHVVVVPGGNLRATEPGTASYNGDTSQYGRTNEVTLKLVWTTGLGTLTTYTGYARKKYRTEFDFDGTYAEISYSSGGQKDRVFQHAFDFAVDAGDRFDLIVGGMYFNDKLDSLGGKSFGANRTLTQTTFVDLKTSAYAVYADATWHATDALHINIGGRYSVDDRFISEYITPVAGPVTYPYIGASKTFKRFTPRASIRYEVAPRTNVYASYSKGFRSGSFNATGSARALIGIPTKPEDINAFELGFKTAQSWLRFEAAGFYYKYKNLNVSLTVPNPTCPPGIFCGPITVQGNAPKAKIYGIDGQLVMTPAEKFNLTIGGAWIHARYGSFANAVGTGLNPVTNANIPGQVQDWSGNQMSRAPNFTAVIGADYTIDLGGGALLLSGAINYSDSYAISNASVFGPLMGALATKQRYRNPKTTLINGEATWTSPDEHFWFGVFGKNLTNKKYRATYNGANFGDYSTQAAPITYGVKAGYKF